MADLQEKVSSIANQAAQGASAAVQNAAGKVRDAANSGFESHSSERAEVNVGSTERILSVAGGVLLFGWGLARRGLVGYGAMTLAAALWDRGVRGHCGVYSAIGKNTAESDSPDYGMGNVKPAAQLP